MKLDKTKAGWWKNAVFYQIYPKSFQDTTGSGTGDLQGIISRLDYLETLGIDGIWLSPVCQSPQVDNGYDISDYCSVDPMFGSMEDMETLIREAKKRNISIILDLVLNHSSNQHQWFQEALKGKDNPYYHYYIWRDGTPDQFPNDMQSVFGGPAWTYVPELKQYYFHQFAPEQPDLNWENPQLRQALYDSIRFWVDKGIEGFRLDVIDQIGKDPDLKVTGNGPKLHDYLRELSENAFPAHIVTVGEAWGADVERAKLYSAPDGSELSMVFQFQHICLDQGSDKWDMRSLELPKLKACLTHWQQGLHGQGWNSLFFNNHDLPRIVSRWGNDGHYRVESAKMLATMLHGMEGTPYIYQGEELGMTNIRLDIHQYDDVEIKNLYNDRITKGCSHDAIMASIWARGRDNARTPMQWSAEKNAGFTSGTPWLPVNENHSFVNAESALADDHSVFHYYRRLIALRKQYSVFRDGSFALQDAEDPYIFAYTRDTETAHLLVVCNFTENQLPYELPDRFHGSRLLLSNYDTDAPGLRPYEAAIFYYNSSERSK